MICVIFRFFEFRTLAEDTLAEDGLVFFTCIFFILYFVSRVCVICIASVRFAPVLEIFTFDLFHF